MLIELNTLRKNLNIKLILRCDNLLTKFRNCLIYSEYNLSLKIYFNLKIVILNQ